MHIWLQGLHARSSLFTAKQFGRVYTSLLVVFCLFVNSICYPYCLFISQVYPK